MDHKCTFFTDKDHVGTICLSSFVVGMVISLTVGLKFLHHKQKEREYESVQSHPIPYSSTYRNILNSSVNRIANPRRTFRGTSYANENDNYLDPVPKNADSNYLDPVPCHRYSDYLTPSQGLRFNTEPYENEKVFVGTERNKQKKTKTRRTLEYMNLSKYRGNIPKNESAEDYLEPHA